jgi:hypothetical protein
MFKQQRLRTAGIVAASVIGIAVVAAAQSARSAVQPGASADELVNEVRGLRAEFNQAVGSSLRTQLLVARLQIQEQRVNAVGRQLADVQERLASVRQGQAAMVERLAASEEGQQRLPPEDRSDDQIRALKLQQEQIQKREQDLRAQESAASNSLAAEQSRWAQINASLDALERSLADRAPR